VLPRITLSEALSRRKPPSESRFGSTGMPWIVLPSTRVPFAFDSSTASPRLLVISLSRIRLLSEPVTLRMLGAAAVILVGVALIVTARAVPARDPQSDGG
jgi:hypothetical protein